LTIDHVPPADAFVKAAVFVPVQTDAAPPPITAGKGFTVKVPILVAVPPAVVTLTVPVVPTPITATSVVPLFEVIEETGVPPILRLAAVAPIKFVPVIVIFEPTHPLEGLMLVIVGGGGEKTHIVPFILLSELFL
jgi:hypothetical protein